MNLKNASDCLSERFTSFTDEELVFEEREFHLDGAFEELDRRYRSSLERQLRARFKLTSEQLDDALQGTFLRVWKNIDSFKLGFRFQSWIHCIAWNQAIDQLRSDNRHSICVSLDALRNDDDLSLAGVVKDDCFTPDDAAERKELICVVRHATKSLPPRYREVLELIYYRGMSCARVAERLGIAAATVSRRAKKALELLAVAINSPCAVVAC